MSELVIFGVAIKEKTIYSSVEQANPNFP